jgi:hypothetical protein
VTWKEDPTVFKLAPAAPDFIHFFDANNGVCVGDGTGAWYEIYTTSNAGTSWSKVPPENIPTKLAGELGAKTHVFTSAGSSLWFPTIGGNGRFYRTTDKGLTWSALVNPKTPYWYYSAIEFQDENVGLCNSDWGDLRKTTDGGITWTTIPTSLKFVSQDLKYVPNTPGTYVASAAWPYNSLELPIQYGTLYTLDGGIHWTMATASAIASPPANLTLPVLSFSTPTSGWQGDMSANIYKWTVPSGKIIGVHPASFVFSTLEGGDTSDIVSVDFVNHGSDPVTLSSIAMPGKEFTVTRQPTLPVTLPSLGSARVELCFTPSIKGTHRDSLVFVSSASNAPRATVPLEGTIFQPAADGAIYAASASLYSMDMATLDTNEIGPLEKFFVQGMTIRPTTRVLYGTSLTATTTALIRICCATVYESVAQTFPVPKMAAIAFDRDGHLYGATKLGRLYRLNLVTGDTIGIGTAPGVVYASIAFSPSGRLWASVAPSGSGKDNIYTVDTTTGAATLVGRTGDSTVTWSVFFDPKGRLYGLKSVGDQQIGTVISIDTLTGVGTTLFSTGLEYIASITMLALMTGVDEPKGIALPHAFSLYQNYPNPFNPSTTIKFELPRTSNVSLTVFDILGREVSMLVNERKNAGVHEVKFDASRLSSGVYFYRMQARDFVQTRKLLLLK